MYNTEYTSHIHACILLLLSYFIYFHRSVHRRFLRLIFPQRFHLMLLLSVIRTLDSLTFKACAIDETLQCIFVHHHSVSLHCRPPRIIWWYASRWQNFVPIPMPFLRLCFTDVKTIFKVDRQHMTKRKHTNFGCV